MAIVVEIDEPDLLVSVIDKTLKMAAADLDPRGTPAVVDQLVIPMLQGFDLSLVKNVSPRLLIAPSGNVECILILPSLILL